MAFNVPPASSVVIGPIGLHAGEKLIFNSSQRNLTMFVTVQTDDPDADVAMSE